MTLRDLARVWIPGVCKHEQTRCIHGDEGWARMSWRGVVRRQACLDCGRALDRSLPVICTNTGTPHSVLPPAEGCTCSPGGVRFPEVHKLGCPAMVERWRNVIPPAGDERGAASVGVIYCILVAFCIVVLAAAAGGYR